MDKEEKEETEEEEAEETDDKDVVGFLSLSFFLFFFYIYVFIFLSSLMFLLSSFFFFRVEGFPLFHLWFLQAFSFSFNFSSFSECFSVFFIFFSKLYFRRSSTRIVKHPPILFPSHTHKKKKKNTQAIQLKQMLIKTHKKTLNLRQHGNEKSHQTA